MLRANAKPAAAAILAVLVLLSGCVPAGVAPGYLWGPHLNAVTSRSAVIAFALSDNSPARVEFWPAGRPELAASIGCSVQSAGFGGSRVLLADLAPASLYTYRVVRTDGLSGDYSFRTAPADSAQPFTFLVCGDTQGFSGYSRVLSEMSREDAAFWLNPGDLVGAWTTERWTRFLRISREVLARMPFHPALGNHDVDDGSIQRLFDVPGPSWYSFDQGPLHVIALDTCKDYSPGSAQYDWLARDLAESQAQPWRLAFFHHPPYSPTKADNTMAVRDFLSPLFEQYGVRIVFSGHSHVYDRYYVDGVHYVVTGGGGGWPYSLETSSYNAPYHFLRVSVSIERLDVECVKPGGCTIDRFSVSR